MPKGLFTDRKVKPDYQEISTALSGIKPAWDELINYIDSTYKIKGEYKFYGKNFGWALRFNKSGKSLIALYPSDNAFTAQIILNAEQVKEALLIIKNGQIIKTIRETTYIIEGKWIYIKMSDISLLDDIKNLIRIRASIKKKYKNENIAGRMSIKFNSYEELYSGFKSRLPAI